MNVDLQTMIGNVFGAYCAGNRRATFRSPLQPATIRTLLNLANGPSVAWFAQTTTSMLQVDTKGKIDKLDTELRDLIVQLTSLPQSVADIGDVLMAETSQCDVQTPVDNGLDWKCRYIVGPGLGYPRVYTRPSADSGVEKYDGTVVPSIHNEWSLSIAAWLMNIDRGATTLALIKQPGELMGHDPREQPFGQFYSVFQQIENMIQWLTLQLIQGCCLYPHVHYRLNRANWELAYATERRARPALDAWWENYEYLTAQPLHSLLTVIASAMRTGTVDTPMGTRDLLYLAGDGMMPKEHEDVGTSTAYNQSRMTRVLNAAIYDFGNPSVASMNWGDPALSKKEYLTIGEAARLLRSLSTITKRWDAVATELGWKRLSGDIGVVNARGADFIITDGRDYSASPIAGLLGIRPVISAGNVKIGGYSARYESAFNIKKGRRIQYSAMVADGYQGATGSPSLYERNVMPASMVMGEGDISRTYASTMLSDGIGKIAYDWYTKKQPAYVDEFYQAIPAPSPNILATPGLEVTDWDIYGSGDTPRQASDAYLSYYTGQTTPFGDGIIVETSTRFYHRFVVKIARSDELANYDEMWNGVDPIGYEGDVLYDGEINISHSSTEIENIINSLPLKIRELTGLPIAAGGDQVKVTSE